MPEISSVRVCLQPSQPQRTPNNRAVDLPDSPPMSRGLPLPERLDGGKGCQREMPCHGVDLRWRVHRRRRFHAVQPRRHVRLARRRVRVVQLPAWIARLSRAPGSSPKSRLTAHRKLRARRYVAALQWVKKKSRAFGETRQRDDFGESAGAAISSALVGVPQAKGLFQRSISESGTWMGLSLAPMRSRESAEQQTVKTAEQIGRQASQPSRAPAEERRTSCRSRA